MTLLKVWFFMNEFFLCFVPLFVAVDPPGILPLFLSLTEGVDVQRKRRAIVQSVFTASGVALVFLFLGKVVLKYLGITIADFMIAGGVLLFVLSLNDLLSSDKPQRRVVSEHLGAVPLGVPLIVGPAVLTTAMLLVDKHGVLPATGAVIANVMIAGGVFLDGRWHDAHLGGKRERRSYLNWPACSWRPLR